MPHIIFSIPHFRILPTPDDDDDDDDEKYLRQHLFNSWNLQLTVVNTEVTFSELTWEKIATSVWRLQTLLRFEPNK